MRVRTLGLVSAIVFTLFVAGCSSKTSQTSEQPSSAPAASAAATVNPATAGEITGTVKLAGTPPKMRVIQMGADPACEKAGMGPMHSEQVVVGPGNALEYVVVYIKSGLGNYSYTTPTEPVTLDQKGCMYSPHVVALMTNQPFHVVNSDPFLHNIHVTPKINREWNEAQPAGAPPIVQTFPHAEMAIPIHCNIHPWMDAFAFVFDNPYFAVTGDDGTFTIKNVPPGTYTIETWQQLYGTQDQQVTVAANQTKTVDFSYKAQ